MKVKVVLLENIPALGKIGDIVIVARGFFRNYLYPRKKASFASDAILAQIQDLLNHKKKGELEQMEIAKDIKNQIASAIIKFTVQATDDGKIFGSIELKDIRNKINDQIANLGFDYRIQNENLILNNNVNKIKQLGNYSINISFFKDITVDMQIVIERQ